MKLNFKTVLILSVTLIGGMSFSSRATAEEGAWKTAFFKRGFVGNFNADWASGLDSTIRQPIPIYFAGTKARVFLNSSREEDVQLAKMTLAKGANWQGEITGNAQPILFGGTPGIEIKALAEGTKSDESPVPIDAGLWYLQQTYSSPKYPYAYDIDGFYAEPGDAHDQASMGEAKSGAYVGGVYRIDVLTTDKRPVIACYGDSITQGYNSTPNSGNRYPELLSGLLKQPTLNLGTNGDLAIFSPGAAGIIASLEGVETVVFLMGINDIVNGVISSPEQYTQKITDLINGLKSNGQKVFIGTIFPAGGFAKFDDDPSKEVLRQRINEWIRGGTGADGFIDFDEALRDPANPIKLKEEYQSDWLHPSDAGYKKMAETAAAKIKS